MIVLLALVLVDDDLFALDLSDHLALDLGAGQSGSADFHALVRAQHQHVEADLAVHFLVQLFHVDNVPLGHTILLATGYDHSVHGKAPPE